MSWINSSVAAIIPFFPKWFLKPFAKPYVAGENLDIALEHIRRLNGQGFTATLDVLGEHVRSKEEAVIVQKEYCDLYDHLGELEKGNTVSLKLTHLGLELDHLLAEENLFAILERAKALDMGLTIDMENSLYTDITLELYRKALATYAGVGTVIQAYLKRSLDDLKTLDSPQLHLRICKGIYREGPTIAFQKKKEIRQNFLTLCKTLIQGQGYACLATHDTYLLDELETFIEAQQISKSKIEFQVLYGVPMGNRLTDLRDKGYLVRVYVPFGKGWFEYSIRRLKENPSIIAYVMGNMFKR